MIKKACITICGKVQRVGFRWFVSYTAKNYNLKGFVKNTSDKNVYVEVEGDENILNDFIKEIKKGPPLSKVENVIINYLSANYLFIDFRIQE
ncbi:MAG: acylphosphatase [Bacteroidetes bacterium]|nr:acylphosphatase [Bacteroidota bacterium]